MEIVPPEFEELSTGLSMLTGLPRNSHRMRINDGSLRCKNPGCTFEQKLWDFDRAKDEAINAKYSETFWRSRFWRNVKEIISTIFWACFWLTVLGVVIYVLLIYPDQKTCSTLAQQFGLETQWNLWTGCMVHSEKFGWIPKDEFFKFLNLNIP